MDSMGGLLTNGFNMPACQGLILTPFNLRLMPQQPPVVNYVGANGGSRPMAPGEIQNFYKPIDSSYYANNNNLQYAAYKPPVKLFNTKFTISINSNEHVKEYTVPTRPDFVNVKVASVNNLNASVKFTYNNITRSYDIPTSNNISVKLSDTYKPKPIDIKFIFNGQDEKTFKMFDENNVNIKLTDITINPLIPIIKFDKFT